MKGQEWPGFVLQGSTTTPQLLLQLWHGQVHVFTLRPRELERSTIGWWKGTTGEAVHQGPVTIS